ncbi:MAG: DUF4430 domain-containing protein [Patescibacteria group bacterium]
MKKSIYIISIAAIGAVLFGEQLVGFTKAGLAGLKGADIFQKETSQEEIKGEVFLEINYGDENVETFSSEFANGTTALSLLEDAIEELRSKLRTKTYGDTGAFVELIGDKESGQDGKYWLYYVNGQMPSVAADKQELKPGDKVEFRFEEPKF